MDQIAAYEAEKIEVLSSLDEARIKEFCRKYEMRIPQDPETFWAGTYKEIYRNEGFSPELKMVAKEWLLLHGFSLEIRENV